MENQDFASRLGAAFAATVMNQLQPQVTQGVASITDNEDTRQRIAAEAGYAFQKHMNTIIVTITAIAVLGVGAYILYKKR